jgi:formylglycine-generating enzyme required for sulfatase activity
MRNVIMALLAQVLISTALASPSCAAAPLSITGGKSLSSAILLAQGKPEDSLEVRFWKNIKGSESADDFRIYLDAYPDGLFAAQARARLQELQKKGRRPPAQTPPAKQEPETAAQQADKPSPSAVISDCPQCPQLVLIPPGAFNMGSTEMFPFEGPVHQVTIHKAFYIGQREVTIDEWGACVGDGGCSYTPPRQGGTSGSLPVTNLDWSDAQKYVAWLKQKTGKAYRLPSESEWEYAARAGTRTTYPWGDKMEPNRANCSGCNDPKNSGVVPTGSFPANGFNLFDMSGNAAEWVEDCWNDSYKAAPTDGSAWTKPQCQERVLRGGSFNNDPRYLRSASRFKYDFDVRYYTNGFRVVREK